MAESTRRRRRRRFVAPLLRITAEAGWLTVVYASAAAILGHEAPLLGPLEFIALVGVGVIVAALTRGSATIGALVLIDAVIVAGLLGWLASPEARELALVNPAKGLVVHISGWLAGFAVFRGATINIGRGSTVQTEQLLRTALPGVAVVWAITTVLVKPLELWLPFAVTAMWGTVLLIVVAMLSIGMSRLDVLHAGLPDRTARIGWRWVVVFLALLIGPVAAPFVVLSGIPVDMLMAPLSGPLEIATVVLSVPLQIVVGLLTAVLSPFAGGVGDLIDQIGHALGNTLARPRNTAASPLGTAAGIALIAFVVALNVLAIYFFVRWLLLRRSAAAPETDPLVPPIERTIVRPTHSPRPSSGRRFFVRRIQARDAVSAYVAALAELDSRSQYARLPSETPAAHARRVRLLGMPGGSELSRLAADYQLARYGQLGINEHEQQRAIARFERLRRLIRATSGRSLTTS